VKLRILKSSVYGGMSRLRSPRPEPGGIKKAARFAGGFLWVSRLLLQTDRDPSSASGFGNA
jgi:hypothetical protein